MQDARKHQISTLRSGALAALPEGFHALDGASKVNAILDLRDPEAFVRALAPDTFYHLVRQIGAVDCTELVAMSTPAQRQVFVDAECWDGAELDVQALDEWLDLVGESSHDLLVETVAELDPELVAAYLMGRVVAVFDRTEETEIEQYEQMFDILWTPDRDFAIVLPKDDAGEDDDLASRVERMLDLAYAHDVDFARSLLFSAKSGLAIEQTEQAYRFRSGRLADLGFMEPHEARELYAPIRIEALRASVAEQDRPVVYDSGERLMWALSRVREGGRFLSECLGRHADPDRFAREFALCVNRAAMAAPGGLVLQDFDRLVSHGEAVHATVSLGLEVLADGDVERGVQILDRAWLIQLFQAGHSLAVERAVRARRLRGRGAGLFEQGLDDTIEALQRVPQPLFVERDGGKRRHFASLADLRDVDLRLAEGEVVCDVFENVFGFSRERFARHTFARLSPDDKGFIRFETLARTLACHVALGGGPSFEPLTAGQVLELRRRLDGVPEAVKRFAEPLPDAARDLLERAAGELVDELGRLPADEAPDPRFVGGLVLTS